jgi:hypothetical protein
VQFRSVNAAGGYLATDGSNVGAQLKDKVGIGSCAII